MSSDEEDRNPKKQQKSSKEEAKGGKEEPKKAIVQTTELENEEYDDEEDRNLSENDKAIKETVTGITVKVDNPQIKDGGTFAKNYTVYDVSGSDKNGSFNVKRRYNEFNKLRAKLLENWPWYFIPPIPEKKSTGNTDPAFIKQRQHMLNHFMERCARMPHIFYSDEIQAFLRFTGTDLEKHLSSIKVLTPTQMYERNKSLFPEYDKELTDKVENSVKRYFQTLEKTIKFFQSFRSAAKQMHEMRPRFKQLKTQFIRYAINDYKNKLKGEEVKKSVDDQYKDYKKEETEDDLLEFLKNLKDLELDLTNFFLIKEALKKIRTTIDAVKKKQEEANKNLSRVRTLEGDVINEGMFKKVNKVERINQLEKEIQDCQNDVESLEKNRCFAFHLLNNHEFPILVNDKRTTFAKGILGFSHKRTSTIDKELNLLKMMHDHYKKY